MTITLITGVPGTGKTAYLVSELEKISATGRTIFVDNVPGLLIPHYRAGKISEWQKGTWLHIDQFNRTTSSITPTGDLTEDDTDENQNWIPNPEITKDENGKLHRNLFDAQGNIISSAEYENHKGALLVIDECQRHFRPRPAGSAVPDFVAALEVHRHQGLDIWLVTQRPGLVDANVRALCGKHVALRSTPFGRYRYEWPEVGDIDNKTSRDVAAKSRFKLPKHIFSLYKSAEVHTSTSHKLPMVVKVFFLCIPILLFLLWSAYNMIQSKINPKPDTKKIENVKSDKTDFNNHLLSNTDTNSEAARLAAAGFERYIPPDHNSHPFAGKTLSIVARLQSATRDLYRFAVSSEQGMSFVSSDDLLASGYSITQKSDCSVKISYSDFFATFITCGIFVTPSPSPLTSNVVSSSSETVQPLTSRSYENVVLANGFEGTRY